MKLSRCFLEEEIHHRLALLINGLRAYARAAFGGEVVHLDVGHEALEIGQEDAFVVGFVVRPIRPVPAIKSFI